ncbi:MAG: sodium:calcium antiporter, partial [Nitrospinales bacterium]
IAAFRGHAEMSIGNIYGSNIFNILMVIGTASAIHPLYIEEPIHPDLLITSGLTCLFLVLLKIDHGLSKIDGLILLLCYVAYIGSKSMGIV